MPACLCQASQKLGLLRIKVDDLLGCRFLSLYRGNIFLVAYDIVRPLSARLLPNTGLRLLECGEALLIRPGMKLAGRNLNGGLADQAPDFHAAGRAILVRLVRNRLDCRESTFADETVMVCRLVFINWHVNPFYAAL